MMKPDSSWLVAVMLAFVFACGDSSTEEGPEGEDPTGEVSTLTISGTVVDFATGEVISGSATVSTDGLSPAPTVSITGSDFTIDGVAPYSTFHLLVGSPPDYRSTYNVVLETADEDLADVELTVLSEDFIDELYAAFGVIPSDGTSLILAQLVDQDGNPVAGVPAEAFALEPNVEGPFFLDADRQADDSLTASSASGYVALFNVEPGLVSLQAEIDSGYAMTMADSPVADRSATIAVIEVTEGEIVIPTGVSFSQDVAPIFQNRGCVLCHDGGGIGKDLGGLHLNGEPNKMHKELTEELSAKLGVTRVDLANPEDSILLRYPSREDPPDSHPNATFLSSTDPDYLIILGWIQEGALKN